MEHSQLVDFPLIPTISAEQKHQFALGPWFRGIYPETFQFFNVPIQIHPPLSMEGLLPVVSAVHAEIAEVKGLLRRQQDLLEQILAVVHVNGTEIQIDDVSDEDARTLILALFKDSRGSLFYDEIAERLKLPLRQTVEICNQLETEGLIGEPGQK